MRGRARSYPPDVVNFIEHVLYGLHQLGAVLYQLMAADRQWILDTTRDAEHLPTLLGGHARGDQRAASFGGLDHDHTEAEAADDPVADGKTTWERQRPVFGLRHERAGPRDGPRQLGVLRRVDAIQSGGHHRDRRRRGLQGAAMCRSIDTTRQSADHHHTGAGQLTRQPVCGATAVWSSSARTDDRDGWRNG